MPKNKNTTHKDPGNDDINSLVSSFMKPAFSLINKIIPKQFELSRYIWYILTILVLLIGLKYEWFNLNTTLLLFAILFVLEFISLNFEAIKTLFKNKDSSKIQTFLNEIDNKNLESILEFMENYVLSTDDLKRILNTKYKHHIDLHNKIIKTQDCDCDFMDFLVESNIIEKLPPKIISSYIAYCTTSLNEKSLNHFSKTSSFKIKGAIVLTHGILIKSTTIWQKILRPFLIVSSWFSSMLRNKNYKAIFLILLTCGVMVLYIYASTHQPSASSNIHNQNDFFMNFLGGFIGSLILSGILIYFLTLCYMRAIMPFWGWVYRSSQIIM